MRRWRGGGWAVVLAWLLALLLANPAWAERVALVIGNDAYRHGGALNNAVGDARKVGDALERLGFRVIRKQNLSYTGLLDALDALGQAAAGAEWAVVYYAGHAIQVQGRNYLLPVDVALNREGDLRRAVLLDDLLGEINQARDLGLVILDACRDNPFAARLNQGAGRSVAGRGLARVGQTGGNTLVAFATREDTIAADSGLYAAVLVEHLATPGLEVRQLFGKVRDAVMARTGNQQQPFTYGSLGGGHYAFKPGAASVPPPPPPADHDLIAWQSAEKCGTAACFRAYLKTHPQGRYAELARARLEPAAGSAAPAPPAEPTCCKLWVKATPADAKVRIMSIVPAYQDGMVVARGRHRIRVERSGYEAYDQWMEINQAEQVVMVDLQKHVSILNPPDLPSLSPSPSELLPAEITFKGNQRVAALLDSADRFVKNNQLPEAGAALERALRIEPRNSGIWHDLAQIHLHQGAYQQAESLASKSNNLAGGNRSLQARNWRLIAVARKATGNTAGAAEAEIQAANLLTP